MKAQNKRPSANIVVPQVDIRTCAVLQSVLHTAACDCCSRSWCAVLQFMLMPHVTVAIDPGVQSFNLC